MGNSKSIFLVNLILFVLILTVIFVGGLFLMQKNSAYQAQAAVSEDVSPPKISEIKIEDVSFGSSTITWITDENADSLINYGLERNYGVVRDPIADKTSHKIILDDLLPDKRYYFRITSTDDTGNQGISSDFSFITDEETDMILPLEELQNILEKDNKGLIQKIIAMGNEGIDEEVVDGVIEAIQEMVAEGLDDTLENKEFKVETTDEVQEITAEDIKKIIGEIDKTGVGGMDQDEVQELMEALEELITGGDLDESEESRRENKSDLGAEASREGEDEGDQFVGNESEIMEEILELIEQLTEEEALEQVDELIESKAEDLLLPPTIILDYADVEVGTDWAVITWQTDKDSNSMVALADEYEYDEEYPEDYVWSEGHPDEMVMDHYVEVNGLDPATEYHFQVSSKSKLDLTGRSTDKVFKTKSVLPEINNIQITKVQEESATIRWSTNIPCSSVIEYTNLNNSLAKLEGNSTFLSAHSITLTNLIFDTYYSFVIRVESEDGEKSESIPMTFITIRDKAAPVISKVNTESTLYPGSENKIQTIISWTTDEVAECQMFYHQGLVSDDPMSLPMEEEFSSKHVNVGTNFLPGAVYKFWIMCYDEAKNETKSQDFTMLTPSREESIIDIIIKNFESSFGWVKG